VIQTISIIHVQMTGYSLDVPVQMTGYVLDLYALLLCMLWCVYAYGYHVFRLHRVNLCVSCNRWQLH